MAIHFLGRYKEEIDTFKETIKHVNNTFNLYTVSHGVSHGISQYFSLTGTHTGRQSWWRSRQVTTQSVTEDNMSQEDFEGGKNRLWRLCGTVLYSFYNIRWTFSRTVGKTLCITRVKAASWLHFLSADTVSMSC